MSEDIKKIKELEERIQMQQGAISSLLEVGAEHIEMIDLMAKQLTNKSFMKKVCKECPFEECLESKPKNCVIEYYKNKVKELINNAKNKR